MLPFLQPFPFRKQPDMMDCGPTCLQMIAAFYGKSLSLPWLRQLSHIGKNGVSLAGITEAAEKTGFRTLSVKASIGELMAEKAYPFVVHWRNQHFVVVYGGNARKVKVADPAHGKLTYPIAEFSRHWAGDLADSKNPQQTEGIALLLEPLPAFYQEETVLERPPAKGWSFLFPFLLPFKKQFGYLLLTMLLGSLFTLLLPFLTQALVDKGIAGKDLGFVWLLLLGQLVLFTGKMYAEGLRSWFLLHISTRLNVWVINRFFEKMMELPMPFFEAKNLGDILQRIRDHDRVKQFLTSTSLEFAFSQLNLLVLGTVMALYSLPLFGLFVMATLLYIGWVMAFMKKRKAIDHKRFQEASELQANEIQLVQGMAEIKLHGAEKQKRQEWEGQQVRLFHVHIASLKLEQWQQYGGVFLNELKNIALLFLAASEVMEGKLTLGMMLAVQQMIGQMNTPVLQFIRFVQATQDARLSLDRISEVHEELPEDPPETESWLAEPAPNQDIRLEKVWFRYGSSQEPWVLKNLNLSIPAGKTTAIVGASGSGKTTLLKLLLRYYAPQQGHICLGATDLQQLKVSAWRKAVGTVTQDGRLFKDSIARNVALGAEEIEPEQLSYALRLANMEQFVRQMPQRQHTVIGPGGTPVSQGQQQRLLIARAVYKNPEWLFFDEATSALDAKNEREITDHLRQFAQGKGMVVVAHRLSTVKQADQIIVLDQGEVAEIGTHQQLTAQKGIYYELIKNQLELGS